MKVWERCKCDQYGRCLADCPSADRADRPGPSFYWNRKTGEWVWR